MYAKNDKEVCAMLTIVNGKPVDTTILDDFLRLPHDEVSSDGTKTPSPAGRCQPPLSTSSQMRTWPNWPVGCLCT
eukprot:11509993-Ditylum_brightwellii.AAC.1